jgi:hypothetical protein
MAHLEYESGVIAVSNPYAYFDFNYDLNINTGHKRPIVSFVGPSPASMRERRLTNARIGWEYQYGNVAKTVAATKRLASLGSHQNTFDDLLTVIRDLDELAGVAVRKAVFGQGMPVESLWLRCHSEQIPNPDSRVTSGAECDAFGSRRVVLDWRLTAEDKRSINDLHHLLGTEVGRTGFGRLRYDLSEDGSTWPDDLLGNAHQMGTTRMHRDPKLGVVNENCRVHSMANLYVAGSSVFPTSGSANPTLTIVALALRLADHIWSPDARHSGAAWCCAGICLVGCSRGRPAMWREKNRRSTSGQPCRGARSGDRLGECARLRRLGLRRSNSPILIIKRYSNRTTLNKDPWPAMTDPVPYSISPRESIYLDFVRALAAFFVVLDHAPTLFDLPNLPRWGHQAVMVFFVLSGYVICNVADTRETDVCSFLVARLARLWSVLLPAMV